MGRLNGGILPRGYYALAEQVVRGPFRTFSLFRFPGQSRVRPLSRLREIGELRWRIPRPGFIAGSWPTKVHAIAPGSER